MGKKAHQRVKPTLPTPTGNLIHLPPNSSRAHMPIGAVLRLRSSRTPPPGYARRPTPLSSQPHSCASASPVRVTCCTSASSRPHDEPRLCLLPAAARISSSRRRRPVPTPAARISSARSPAAARPRRLHGPRSGGPSALLPAAPRPCGGRRPRGRAHPRPGAELGRARRSRAEPRSRGFTSQVKAENGFTSSFEDGAATRPPIWQGSARSRCWSPAKQGQSLPPNLPAGRRLPLQQVRPAVVMP